MNMRLINLGRPGELAQCSGDRVEMIWKIVNYTNRNVSRRNRNVYKQ